MEPIDAEIVERRDVPPPPDFFAVVYWSDTRQEWRCCEWATLALAKACGADHATSYFYRLAPPEAKPAPASTTAEILHLLEQRVRNAAARYLDEPNAADTAKQAARDRGVKDLEKDVIAIIREIREGLQ